MSRTKILRLYQEAHSILVYQDEPDIAYVVDSGGLIPTSGEFTALLAKIIAFYERYPDSEIEAHNNEVKHSFRPSTNKHHPTTQRTRARRPTAGWIYILHGAGYYKIGKTRDINDRLKQISPKLPFPIELVCKIQTGDIDKLERLLHARFNHKRTNGEWFRLDDQDIESLQNLAAKGLGGETQPTTSAGPKRPYSNPRKALP